MKVEAPSIGGGTKHGRPSTLKGNPQFKLNHEHVGVLKGIAGGWEPGVIGIVPPKWVIFRATVGIENQATSGW